MSLATAFLAQLSNRGIRVEYRGPGELALIGMPRKPDPTVMAAFEIAKPALLELLTPAGVKEAMQTPRIERAIAEAANPENVAGESVPPAKC